MDCSIFPAVNNTVSIANCQYKVFDLQLHTVTNGEVVAEAFWSLNNGRGKRFALHCEGN